MALEHEIEATVAISSEGDIIAVRKASRKLAETLGFSITDITRIVTASSELARNVYLYAGTGTAQFYRFNTNGNTGMELIFADNGPGIPDVGRAMESGYTTGGGLGMGLPGTKRLMDEMEIETAEGKGTTVKVAKWLKKPRKATIEKSGDRDYPRQ